MKLMNIFPVMGAILIAACTTNPANTNVSGGDTNPPVTSFDLDRKELSFYTDLLGGEIQTQLETFPISDNISASSRSTDYFRLETENSILPSHPDIALPAQATYTNDTVEEISFTDVTPSGGGNLILSIKKVTTRRGFVSGNVPKAVWSNDTVQYVTGDLTGIRLSTTPNIIDQNGQAITAPTGYTAYLITANRFYSRIAQINPQTQAVTLSPFADSFREITSVPALVYLINASDTEIRIIRGIRQENAGVQYVDGVVNTYTAVE